MYKLRAGLAVVVILFIGCASPTKNAILLDPAFHNKMAGKICVLPTVDLRIDKSTSIDMDGDIRKPFSDGLKDKGYEIDLLSTFGEKDDMPAEAVAEMSVDELYALGLEQSPSLLVLYLNDVSSNYVVMGYTYKVELTGVLLDKQTKTVLWKDKGIGSSGQGGLISGLMAPLIKAEALSSSVNSMLRSFPEKPKVEM